MFRIIIDATAPHHISTIPVTETTRTISPTKAFSSVSGTTTLPGAIVVLALMRTSNKNSKGFWLLSHLILSYLIINHIPPPSSMWCAKNIHTRPWRVYLQPKLITHIPCIQDTVLCSPTIMKDNISHLSVTPCLAAIGMAPMSVIYTMGVDCFIFGISTTPPHMDFSVLCHNDVILPILGQEILS